MRLNADIARCMDAGCPDRHECLRWIERATGYNHVASLFPFDLPLSERCPHRIAPEEKR